MGHHRDGQGKRKGSKEKQSPMSSDAFSTGSAPPPSYHSFDRIWTNPAICSGASPDADASNRTREREVFQQQHLPRREEVRVGPMDQDERPRHRRPRRSSSSHSSGWVAKLVIRGLRSNLLGSDDSENTHAQSKEPTSSQKPKLRSIPPCRDVHYTVHNHWHGLGPSEPYDHRLSHTKTWPGDEAAGHDPRPFAHLMSGDCPNFGLDARAWTSKSTERTLPPDHPTFGTFGLDFAPFIPPGLNPGLLLKGALAGVAPHALHGTTCSYPSQDVWVHDHTGATQTVLDNLMQGWGVHNPSLAADAVSKSYGPFDQDGLRGHEHGCRHASQRSVPPSGPPNWGGGMIDAASRLADYNKRWDYIDTIQQPYSYELPWPAIRPDVSFDHMKCDAFSFFAKACGLQPDRAKAPKLDFKLSTRSPYPSYDRRQQECERRMLQLFKEQMKREKLRWHEDKLGRKFPEVMGRDEERRKAVWAAIAEGSAICDRRLRNLP